MWQNQCSTKKAFSKLHTFLYLDLNLYYIKLEAGQISLNVWLSKVEITLNLSKPLIFCIVLLLSMLKTDILVSVQKTPNNPVTIYLFSFKWDASFELPVVSRTICRSYPDKKSPENISYKKSIPHPDNVLQWPSTTCYINMYTSLIKRRLLEFPITWKNNLKLPR